MYTRIYYSLGAYTHNARVCMICKWLLFFVTFITIKTYYSRKNAIVILYFTYLYIVVNRNVMSSSKLMTLFYLRNSRVRVFICYTYLHKIYIYKVCVCIDKCKHITMYLHNLLLKRENNTYLHISTCIV